MGGGLTPAVVGASGRAGAPCRTPFRAHPGRRAAWLLVVVALLAVWPPGCASEPEPGGFYYVIRRGDTLYSIGRRHGVPPEALARINRIGDVTDIAIGQRLWIPLRRGARPPLRPVPVEPRSTLGEARFVWPVRGTLTSGFGRRGRSMHEGIDIGGRRGTVVRSTAPGRVIRTGRLGDYGRIVIVKHSGNFSSVYAHLDGHRVQRGDFVEQGQPVGTMGRSGNARGVHLHFEIRYRDAPRNPMQYLPRRG